MKLKLFEIVILLIFTTKVYASPDDGKAAYDIGDFATALKEFKLLADQGNAQAQLKLGDMYEKGRGVTKDEGGGSGECPSSICYGNHVSGRSRRSKR